MTQEQVSDLCARVIAYFGFERPDWFCYVGIGGNAVSHILHLAIRAEYDKPEAVKLMNTLGITEYEIKVVGDIVPAAL